MCTVLLPPGVNPIAVNKYIVSYHNHYADMFNMHTGFVIEFKKNTAITDLVFVINWCEEWLDELKDVTGVGTLLCPIEGGKLCCQKGCRNWKEAGCTQLATAVCG
jgi:hypothetical protein